MYRRSPRQLPTRILVSIVELQNPGNKVDLSMTSPLRPYSYGRIGV